MNNQIESPTTDLFIPSVIEKVGCQKHEAPKGTPCWRMYPVNGMDHGAICNKRAKSAGWAGQIDPRSLSTGRRRPEKR